MRHVPSIQWCVMFCGAAVIGCSNTTPPPPKPEPPKAVAVAPAEAEGTAKPAAPPATPDVQKPVQESAAAPSAEAADSVAALRQALAAAPDENARVVVIDDIAELGQRSKAALDDLVACTADQDPRTRWHAARAIGLIGEDALSAMPTLIKLLGDTDPIVVTQSAAAIGLIREDDGREAIPAPDAQLYANAVESLSATMTHSDPRVRRAAMRTLRCLNPAPQQLAALLSSQLSDGDPSVVMPALHTLADLDAEAVPVLIEALKNPKSRYWATLALTEIGPEAAPAVETLATLAAEGEIEERMQALLALAAIGEKAAPAASVMAKTLDSDDNSLRFAAAFALGSVRSTDADAVLEKAAGDSDPFLAEVVAWARARIHPEDKALVEEAVKRLRVGLHSERANERTAAASGLSDMAATLDESVRSELANEFADLLSDPDPNVGLSGGAALIRLGATALEPLRSRLSDPVLRGPVLEILAAMGPTAKPAVDDVIKALEDSDPIIRGEAAVTIATIGPDAAAAVPTLLKILTAGETAADGRYSAAYALGRIGPAAKPAAEHLRTLLSSPDEVLATVAAWSMLKITPEDKTLLEQAIPALRKAARADRELVRLEAAVSLGDIGPAAASAIPILELVSEEDSSRQVRDAAAKALKQIRGR
jgi:HEAT repeat protein